VSSVKRCRHRGDFAILKSVNYLTENTVFLWCKLCGAFRLHTEKGNVLSPIEGSKWQYPEGVRSH